MYLVRDEHAHGRRVAADSTRSKSTVVVLPSAQRPHRADVLVANALVGGPRELLEVGIVGASRGQEAREELIEQVHLLLLLSRSPPEPAGTWGALAEL